MSILTRLLGLIDPRLFRDVFSTVVSRNKVPRRLDHVVVDADRVGTHVGDEADVALVAHIEAFIELLGQHHRLLGAEIELADAFLLHRRRRKRRLRLTFTLAFFDFYNLIGVLRFAAAFPTKVVSNGLGLVFMLYFSLLAVDFRQFRRKGQAVFRLIRPADGPIFFRYEGFDGFFSFAN